MATISKMDSNTISTLFSGVSKTKNGVSRANADILGIDYGEYASIKNGSYFKLVKSYYEVEGEDASISTSEDSTKTLTQIDGAAENLKKSAEALYKDASLFEPNEKGEYDKETLYKKVSKLVEDYNELVKASGKANASTIANSGASLVNAVKSNMRLLERVGITMSATDFTLKVDEDEFKDAKMADIKTLFQGNGSFAYSMTVKASMLSYYAEAQAAKSNTYGQNGMYTYNFQTGTLYNGTT